MQPQGLDRATSTSFSTTTASLFSLVLATLLLPRPLLPVASLRPRLRDWSSKDKKFSLQWYILASQISRMALSSFMLATSAATIQTLDQRNGRWPFSSHNCGAKVKSIGKLWKVRWEGFLAPLIFKDYFCFHFNLKPYMHFLKHDIDIYTFLKCFSIYCMLKCFSI